jgi:hypothetical protein
MEARMRSKFAARLLLKFEPLASETLVVTAFRGGEDLEVKLSTGVQTITLRIAPGNHEANFDATINRLIHCLTTMRDWPPPEVADPAEDPAPPGEDAP